MGLTFSRGDK